MGIIEYSVALVARANRVGVEARILGSVAVLIQIGDLAAERPYPTKDLDLVTTSAQRKNIQTFLAHEGWHLAAEFLLYSEGRETFSSARDFTIDVYYDSVDGNQSIFLGDRINASYPTIEVTDLLFTKLQRIRIRKCDEWDCCALIGQRKVDDVRFAKIIGAKWGLYVSVMDNLSQLLSKCSRDREIRQLMNVAEECPKTLPWKLRACLGRRFKWWQEVYDAQMEG